MKKIILGVFIVCFLLVFSFNKNIHGYGYGFKKNNDHKVPEIGFYKEILDENNAYYVGDKKCVYLTFDVGYDNGYLNKYLDVLKEKNVKATFFVTGDFVNRFSSLLVRIYQDGHLICNHSYHHKAINSMSESEIKADLERLEMAYFDKIGVKMPMIFRPPEGQFDEKSLKTLAKLGYKTIFWSVAHVDWKSSNDNGFDNVKRNLHDGAVILLHTVNEDNYQNLGKIIDYIKEQGYELSTVDKIEKKVS